MTTLFEELAVAPNPENTAKYEAFKTEYDDVVKEYRGAIISMLNVWGFVYLLLPLCYFCMLDSKDKALYTVVADKIRTVINNHRAPLREMGLEVAIASNVKAPLPPSPGYPCCCMCCCPSPLFYANCGEPYIAPALKISKVV